MALIDTLPAAPRTQRGPLQILRAILAPALRRSEAAPATASRASRRPAHEAEYLADIGMEVGF